MSSFVFYGPPGSGKTTLAASFTELDYRVDFLDADRKIKNMKNLESRIKEGSITYTEIKERLTDASLKDRAQNMKYFPPKTPKGYFEVCDIIDDWVNNPPDDSNNTVLVIDSATRINEHLKRMLMHFGKTSKMGFEEWGAFLMNYEDLADTFFQLQPDTYAHCILIAHSKNERGEGGSVLEVNPHIDGQFSEKLGSYVEEMYYFEVESFSKHQKAKFKIVTKPFGLIKHARTSREVQTYLDADMKQILGERKVR